MKISLTDIYGQTIILHNVVSVFTSIIEDNILCVMIKGEEKARRYNVNTLNYWEITK